MATKPLRVLIVDDSVVTRTVLRWALTNNAKVEIVGAASDGHAALEAIDRLKPDLVTLDIEMPGLNGIGVLRKLQERAFDGGVLVVSKLTTAEAQLTNQALELGAFDFILKPEGGNYDENLAKLRADLESKLNSYIESRAPALSSVPQPNQSSLASKTLHSPEIVVIGVSTGGPKALGELLPQLPADFPLPIAIVQHMPPVFTASLAAGLNSACSLNVMEAVDDIPICSGNVYIAPGGKQMRLERTPAATTLRITDDPPIGNCRPSVNLLFRSAADAYGGNVLAVVLTGMGNDGTDGCKLLRLKGARIITQDEATCVVYGMPRCIVEAGLADVVSPLDKIADALNQEVAELSQCK